MKRRTRETRVRRTSILGLLLLTLVLASCKEGSFYAALGDQIAKTTLSIAPTAATITDLSSLTFSASGGTPPYTFSIVSGPGSINSSMGLFTSNGGGTVIIRVTDKNKKTSDAAVTVNATGLLTINPSAVNVGPNGIIQFVASGGIPPYTFSKTLSGSGNPTLNSGTGLYTSGFTVPAVDKVMVTDSATPTPVTKTATINVVAAATNVDYAFQLFNPPAGGSGGQPVLPGSSFTVINNGVAAGSRPLSWWVYVSDSPTFNSAGMQILCNNVTGGLGPGGTVLISIPPTATWPVVPVPGGATKYLFFQIAADDDLNSSNNIAGPIPPLGIHISPPSVDYSATAPSHTGPLVAGGPLNESFTLQNNGTDPGGQNVRWTAYISSNNAASISAFDIVVAAGTNGPLGAAPASTVVNFSGTWPTAPGPYYLKVQLAAAEDINTTNDIQVSGVYNTTYVDLTPPASQILSTGGQVAGGPLNGEFKIQNLGTANTTQPIAWTAYVAPVLTPSLVTYVASGSFAGPVNAGTTSAFIPFAGTWPTATGTWVLVVALSSPEDVVPGNNTASSVAGYGTVPPNIDYAVALLSSTGGQVAAGPINGTFTVQSVGTHAGAQTIYWTAYVSTDSTGTIDGGAVVIDSGNHIALGASPAFAVITFGGTWPSAHGAEYLKVKLSTADDINTTNDIQVSGVYNTTYVDLTPPASQILSTGGQVAGGPLNGEFKIQNLGTANTTQPIAWTAYVAPVLTPSLVTYVASGSFAGPVNTGTTSAFIPFAGTWLTATGTYVLVVTLSSPEDVVPGNNTASSVAGYGTVPPNIDYAVASVSSTGGQVAAGPINGTFTVQSIGTHAGAQTIYWTAYVSTDSTATIDGGAVVIDSGNHIALGASPAFAVITFGGTWPSAHGAEYLKVKLSTADDINTTNDIQVSAVYNTTYVDLTPPAAQILPTGGQVAGGPLNGEFKIQNLGSANTTQPIAWTAYVAPVLTPSLVTYVASGSFAGPVNAGTTSAFIPFAGTWPTATGTYVLVVTVSSPEDTVPGNNTGNSAGYGVVAPHVDYAVSAVTNTGAATAPVQGPLTGSFHLANGGPDKGTQYVSWAAYASESGAVDSSAVLVATGTTPPLVATGSTNIPFSGQWPIHYGNYQLVVSVSVPVDLDTNLVNNVVASGSTAAVGFINETEPNDDIAALVAVQNLGVTLQPGMSVVVTRSLAGLPSDNHDVFMFNTGTATSVSLYLSWASSQGVTLSFYKNLPSVTQLAPTTSTLNGTSLILTWNVDAAGTPRWIDVKNPGGWLAGSVPYTLIITGN